MASGALNSDIGACSDSRRGAPSPTNTIASDAERQLRKDRGVPMFALVRSGFATAAPASHIISQSPPAVASITMGVDVSERTT